MVNRQVHFHENTNSSWPMDYVHVCPFIWSMESKIVAHRERCIDYTQVPMYFHLVQMYVRNVPL